MKEETGMAVEAGGSKQAGSSWQMGKHWTGILELDPQAHSEPKDRR